jgi:hypothetical protein
MTVEARRFVLIVAVFVVILATDKPQVALETSG